MKACGCGRVHDLRDPEAWTALPYVGLMEDGDGGWIALRNCPCRSTLAVDLVVELALATTPAIPLATMFSPTVRPARAA